MRIEQFIKKKPLSSFLEDFTITTLDFDKNSKKILSFCVLQTYCPKETSYEIVKFDTTHGFCHAHKFYKQLDHRGIEILNTGDLRDMFYACKKDIDDNWKKYKRWYVEK
jgi:hypothetical protein